MSFDLNIDNYTLDELVQMFELPANFDKNILEIKESKMRDNIIKNKEINKETQIETLNFLIKAKNIVLNGTNNNNKENKETRDIVVSAYNTNYSLKPVQLEDPGEHMVQVRNESPYVNSYPSQFFPGALNPLKKKTLRKNLNIDSRFRENYYTTSSTNFNINLPLSMNNVYQMELMAIELPTTYYVVSKQYGNNFFYINVNNETTIINIPDGNYNDVTIMNAINAQLTYAGAPFNLISFIVNLSNGTGTGQTLVGPIAENTVTNITLDFQADKFGVQDQNTPLPLKFGWLLGFRNGIYTNNLNYVSEGIANISGPNYFYLVVDDFNNNVINGFYSAFNSSILNKNILSRISLQGPTFGIIQQNNLLSITTPREYFGPVNIVNLNIQLLDEFGRIVNLNNMDFSFCLSLITAYDV